MEHDKSGARKKVDSKDPKAEASNQNKILISREKQKRIREYLWFSWLKDSSPADSKTPGNIEKLRGNEYERLAKAISNISQSDSNISQSELYSLIFHCSKEIILSFYDDSNKSFSFIPHQLATNMFVGKNMVYLQKAVKLLLTYALLRKSDESESHVVRFDIPVFNVGLAREEKEPLQTFFAAFYQNPQLLSYVPQGVSIKSFKYIKGFLDNKDNSEKQLDGTNLSFNSSGEHRKFSFTEFPKLKIVGGKTYLVRTYIGTLKQARRAEIRVAITSGFGIFSNERTTEKKKEELMVEYKRLKEESSAAINMFTF